MSSAKQIVVILGSYRSGTSCVAGVLKELGVGFGPCIEPETSNPLGFGEHRFVREALMAGFLEERGEQWCSDGFLLEVLREWRMSMAGAAEPVIGLKHPLLCVMGKIMERSFAGDSVSYIATDRPAAEIAESLQKCNWRWTRGVDLPGIVGRMLAARDEFLSRHAHERIGFKELLHQPEATIRKVAAFLEISPSAEQLAAACHFVDPSISRLDPRGSGNRKRERRRFLGVVPLRRKKVSDR